MIAASPEWLGIGEAENVKVGRGVVYGSRSRLSF